MNITLKVNIRYYLKFYCRSDGLTQLIIKCLYIAKLEKELNDDIEASDNNDDNDDDIEEEKHVKRTSKDNDNEVIIACDKITYRSLYDIIY